MKTIRVIDFETRSDVDLIKEGLAKYASDPSTDILLLGYKELGKGVAELWEPEDGKAPEFCYSFDDEDMLYAFNGEFEMAIWNEVGVKKYGWKPLPVKNLTCLAALANRYGLPNQMGDVADALECRHQKNPEGKILIQVFCTPKHGWPSHSDVRWQRFRQYCKDDVLAEEDILLRLPAKTLNDTEREMWEYTVHMNLRGIPVDVPSAKQIRRVSEQYRESMYEHVAELTDGKVTKITQVKRIKDYCADHGWELEDLTAYTVQKTLEEDLPDNIMQLLEMRAAIGLSSIGKYIRMQDMSVDGRIFYNQRYYGAHTGRWTGSGVQLLNLPRAAIGSNAKTEEERVALVEDEIAKYFDGRIVDDNPIKSARALIRPMIKAEDGKLICAADYSSVEYVGLEWFAGNYEALERFDKGFNPYIDLGSFIGKVPYDSIDKKNKLYQLGKVGILLCGYGGGALRLLDSAEKQYGTKLDELEASSIVNGYRKLHDKVVKMWYAYARAAVESVERPGKEVELYHVSFKVVTDHVNTKWLTIRLPSGRRLFYNRPFIEMGSRGPEVCHYGFDQKIKKWHIMRMIPGRIAENIVQAAMRDVLINGMRHCKNEGLDIIWTCYDEVVCEVPEDRAQEHYDLLVDCMTRLEDWAKEMPIKADGFFGKRYKKM